MEIVRNNFNHNSVYFKYCVKTAVDKETAASTLPVTKSKRSRRQANWLKASLDKIKFKYNAVFNSSGSHYIILDKQLRIVDFNAAAVGLIKKIFNKQIKTGEHVTEYLDEELFEPIMLSCRRALAGESFTIERRIQFFNKRRTWWSAEYSPAYDDDNNIAGIIFNAADITARKNYEDKIELQNSKLRSISLMQSHDIRGPVCTLMGLVGLIKAENNKVSSEYLRMIEDTIKLLDTRIRDIVECAYEV